MRLEQFFMASVVVLSFTAEKCRQLVGEESYTKSRRERFTFSNCFDMSYGTLICVAKEWLKLYLNYMRAVGIQKARAEAVNEAKEKGMKKANEEGNAAAKRASRQARHIIAPIISSLGDLVETLYVGGTMLEGILRGSGTFVGAYSGGIIGERKLGWLGLVVGSHLGCWGGGRIGLMCYDIHKGLRFLLHLARVRHSHSLSNHI